MKQYQSLPKHYETDSDTVIVCRIFLVAVAATVSESFFFYLNTYLDSALSFVILQVKNWVKELRRMLGNEVVLCIVGNKIDMEKERHVTVEEAET